MESTITQHFSNEAITLIVSLFFLLITAMIIDRLVTIVRYISGAISRLKKRNREKAAEAQGKKYVLIDENEAVNGVQLFRLKAVRDFTLTNGLHVHKGDLGGSIQGGHNLDQLDNAWIPAGKSFLGSGRVCDIVLSCVEIKETPEKVSKVMIPE